MRASRLFLCNHVTELKSSAVIYGSSLYLLVLSAISAGAEFFCDADKAVVKNAAIRKNNCYQSL
jgi:hypothetical protein